MGKEAGWREWGKVRIQRKRFTLRGNAKGLRSNSTIRVRRRLPPLRAARAPALVPSFRFSDKSLCIFDRALAALDELAEGTVFALGSTLHERISG